MKTTIIQLSFLFLISTTIGNSQITVNSSDFFDIGDNNTSTSSNYLTSNSPPGVNMTWNYSSLDTLGWRDNTKYVLPSSVSVGASFPTSNIAEYSAVDTGAIFYKKTGVKLETIGNYYGGTINKYSNPRTEYNFPINYNNTLYDEFKSQYKAIGSTFGSAADSVRLTTEGIIKYKVDSWGSLILPTGKFEVLRTNDTMTFHYTYEEYNSGIWRIVAVFYDTSYSNNFVSNNLHSKSEILTQLLDKNGNVIANSWSDTRPGFVSIEENQQEIAVEIFPNPATSYLTIQTEEEITEYSIQSISGQTIVRKEFDNKTNIDVTKLPSGLYFITLYDGMKTTSKKFIKE